jgi:hypothetical protein
MGTEVNTMDLVHVFLAVGTVIEVAVLGFVAWCSVNVAYSTAQVEETAKKIAEIADRNERMTADILRKVYDVITPQA